MAQAITVNGNTYNDSPYNASSNPNGLANGGWRVNSKFITMLLDTLADATANMRTTSVASLTIGTGSIGPLTLAQDIPFAVGDFVLISDTAAPTTNWMVGQITDRTNDDITVGVTKVAGSGTLSAWTVQLSAVPGEVGDTGPAGVDGTNGVTAYTFAGIKTAAYSILDDEHIIADTSGGPISITVSNATLVAGKKWKITKTGGGVLTVLRNGVKLNEATEDGEVGASSTGTLEGLYQDVTIGYAVSFAPAAAA